MATDKEWQPDRQAQFAVGEIKRHKAVLGEITIAPIADGAFCISFEMEVSRPSRIPKDQSTETGVQAVEPIRLVFSSNFPHKAPFIRLRKDFNQALPHINPVSNPETADFVSPCVYDGSLDNLLVQEGLTGILNHLSEWLRKAASNTLIDPDQGWEPIRRDSVSGYLVANSDELRKRIKSKQGFIEYRCLSSIWTDDVSWGKYSGRIIDYSSTSVKEMEKDVLGKYSRKNILNFEYILLNTFAIFTWPKDTSICDHYIPETIQTLEDLLEVADRYGCRSPLQTALNQFANLTNYEEFPLFIVLAARRPNNLISSGITEPSKIELIAYLLSAKLEKVALGKDIKQVKPDSEVKPLSLRHEITPKLFHAVSTPEKPASPTTGTIVQLGCGSVGSKISLHLAKSGVGPIKPYDNEKLLPHNLARHGLVTPIDNPWNSKAIALSGAIRNLGQKAPFSDENLENIIELIMTKGKAQFPSETALIIDATASLEVMDVLASYPIYPKKARLIQTAMLAQGNIGIICMEGSDRSPNIYDLYYSFWNEVIRDQVLSSFWSNRNYTQRLETGLGCGSHTMIMPDTYASMMSAGMGERIRRLLQNKIPNEGELGIGLLDQNNGCGVSWKFISRKKSIVLEGNNGWNVRMLPEVHEAIEADAQQWLPKESGGFIIGGIIKATQTIIITGIVEPPPGSERSGGQFLLKTGEAQKIFKQISNASGSNLTCVGTWHSHPPGGGASPMDISTLKQLVKDRLGVPAMMLIWTPDSYKVLVNDGFNGS